MLNTLIKSEYKKADIKIKYIYYSESENYKFNFYYKNEYAGYCLIYLVPLEIAIDENICNSNSNTFIDLDQRQLLDLNNCLCNELVKNNIYPSDNIFDIKHLFIDTKFRNNGLGKIFFNKTLELLNKLNEKHNIKIILLNACPFDLKLNDIYAKKLESLISFYKKFGFKSYYSHYNSESMFKLLC